MKQSNTITIAVLGSHSALDICRGAKDEGFKTMVICQKGREKTYDRYYRTDGEIGCVDECIVLDSFTDLLSLPVQKKLLSKRAVFIPHRSFEAYLKFDYRAIEQTFKVPIFGNRYLLKIEERGKKPNQYDILDKGNIRYPKQFINPKKIDRLCLVKVLEKKRRFERAFFLVNSYDDYREQAEEKIKQGIVTKEQLEKAVIEEFVVGVQVNFNFFYSPLSRRLELLGTDTRRQTNSEGMAKITAPYQNEVVKRCAVKYEEAGHIAVTVLESLLEDAYVLGEKFVKASRELVPPGIIGPFALQTIIIPGPPKKEIIVIDVSPRMPGSPGISATPYSGYLYGKSMSVGRRIAKEIKKGISDNKLKLLIT